MEQRRIGQLEASVVGLGCNQFGTPLCDEAGAIEIVDAAIDAGVTFFDTADGYGGDYTDPDRTEGWGRSEEALGKALHGRRDDVVIATKFGSVHRGHDGTGGGSARWIRRAVEDSLRRLGTDHIDLYQLHFPDPDVPIAETLGALRELQAAGVVREIGCSNFDAVMLEEAAATDPPGFASVQNSLNVMQRAMVTDVLPTCERLGVAFIPYSPLGGGMLTGKYRRDGRPTSGTRLTEQLDAGRQDKLFSERNFARIDALDAWATERGHTLLELAFAWLLALPMVTSVIAGASRVDQVAPNAAAGDWHLSADEADEVTALVADL
ncbi:MAG: aldo/keto reductase [Ilumatobacteraceae bacterium]